MNFSLQEKKAVVTGATSGIGSEIAVMLAEQGASVAVIGRDIERGEQVAQRIRAAGGEACVLLHDASDDRNAAWRLTRLQNCLAVSTYSLIAQAFSPEPK